MSRLWANAAGLLVGQSFVLWEPGHAARLLILMRLWVRMPCLVQIRVSFGAVDAGAVPTVVSFEGADAAFAAGAPLDCSSERWPLFFGAPGLGGSAFTRYRDRTYTEVVQVIFDAFLAVAAVGGDGAGRASGACGDPFDRGR